MSADDVDSENGDLNKPKKMKHEWSELTTLESKERVSEWAIQNHLKYFSTTKASFGETDWYRCGLLKRSHHSDCPVKAKIIKHNDRNDFTVWYTTWEHVHPDKNALKMPDKYREEISRQTQSKVKPIHMLKSLQDRFDGEYPLNIRQVRYEKKKNTVTEPIVSHDELINWLKSKKAVPTDLDEPFCLSYNHHPTSGVFNSVFSTKRLLSFAAHSFWAADSTYKMLWQGTH